MSIRHLSSACFSPSQAQRTGDCISEEHTEEHTEEHLEEHSDEHSEVHSEEHSEVHSEVHSEEHTEEHSEEHSEEHWKEKAHWDVVSIWTIMDARMTINGQVDWSSPLDKWSTGDW